MLYQPMDPRGEYLENYRCVDGCQKLNTSTKAVNDTVIWCTHYTAKHFQTFDGISKKFVDEKISPWGNRVVLSGVIYHERKQSHCGHYTSGVNLNSNWLLISDTKILRQQKLQCNSRDTSVPYIYIYIYIYIYLLIY